MIPSDARVLYGIIIGFSRRAGHDESLQLQEEDILQAALC